VRSPLRRFRRRTALVDELALRQALGLQPADPTPADPTAAVRALLDAYSITEAASDAWHDLEV
jgi:hypothetical protein